MYTTNREYRQVLRQFFEMKNMEELQKEQENLIIDKDDEETLDELLYDSESVDKKMNEIFEKTKSIRAFVKIYEIAAAQMFSLDLETGLAVLLSYDYFPFFHAFYLRYHENNINELESMKEYSDLIEKISPKKKY